MTNQTQTQIPEGERRIGRGGSVRITTAHEADREAMKRAIRRILAWPVADEAAGSATEAA